MKILLTIFIICLIYYIYYINRDIVYVKSNIDNNTYIIRRGYNKDNVYLQKSADALAIINKKIVKLIDHLDTKFNYENKYNNDMFGHNIKHLKETFSHSILSEAAIDKRYTTYTINKKDMHICLRTRDNNENLYDINTLMYVILHELAHLCNYDKNDNPINGHGLEFKNIFQMLVKEAINIGIYEYVNYEKMPQEYCGIIISTQII